MRLNVRVEVALNGLVLFEQCFNAREPLKNVGGQAPARRIYQKSGVYKQ